MQVVPKTVKRSSCISLFLLVGAFILIMCLMLTWSTFRSTRIPSCQSLCLHSLRELLFLIKIFFQQSASETHHSLSYWPSINNWILKICPKVQDLNSYLSEVMICSNNIEWKVQEEKIFLLQSMHNAVTLVSAFAVKNFSISCDLCLTLMFYQNQNPSHQLEFWQFKLESQITQW